MGIKLDEVMIKCTLDEDECIDLLTVLRVINQITQEQAWAICYEICVLMQRLSPSNCALIDSLDQIHMHKDGFMHQKSLLLSQPPTPQPTQQQASLITTSSPMETPTTIINQNQNNSPPHNDHHNHHHTQTPPTSPPTPPITPELSELLRRRPALNESELIKSLGIALFWALDYGIPDDEERKLSIAMDNFIYQAHQSKLSLDEVLEECVKRLPVATKSHADLHYKSVCKTLIYDTIELSIFLEKIYTASMVLSDITLDNCLEANHHHHLHHHHQHGCDISENDLSELGEPLASLRALRINDWARLWMQVIRELRQRGNCVPLVGGRTGR